MNNETELLFHEFPFNGSIAVDYYPWTFLLGLSHRRLIVPSQRLNWREFCLWLGPLCVTLTLYGGGQ